MPHSHAEALVLPPGGGDLPEHVLPGLHARGAAVTPEVTGADIHPGGRAQGHQAGDQQDRGLHHAGHSEITRQQIIQTKCNQKRHLKIGFI